MLYVSTTAKSIQNLFFSPYKVGNMCYMKNQLCLYGFHIIDFCLELYSWPLDECKSTFSSWDKYVRPFSWLTLSTEVGRQVTKSKEEINMVRLQDIKSNDQWAERRSSVTETRAEKKSEAPTSQIESPLRATAGLLSSGCSVLSHISVYAHALLYCPWWWTQYEWKPSLLQNKQNCYLLGCELSSL